MMLFVGMLEMWIWKIQLWQLDQIIVKYSSSKSTNSSIAFIMTVHKKFVKQVMKVSPLIGKIFFAYLSLNIPFNGLFTMNILMDNHETLISKLLEIIFVSQQIIVIFIVHYLIAKNNEKLWQLSKQISKIPFLHPLDSKTRIKLNIFIQNINTANKIGISYWIFGNVSFTALFKVCYLKSINFNKLICFSNFSYSFRYFMENC